MNAVTGGTWKPGVLHFGHPAPAEVDRHELEDTHVCFLRVERLHADGLLHVGRSHPDVPRPDNRALGVLGCDQRIALADGGGVYIEFYVCLLPAAFVADVFHEAFCVLPCQFRLGDGAVRVVVDIGVGDVIAQVIDEVLE